MYLTVPELARAVNKSESYVRQHIHRKHLAVHRDGRNVSVEEDEAARWALSLGLSYVPTVRFSKAVKDSKGRSARVTVLTWHPKDARPVNLFTHVRHRRREALGPWASEPEETWSSRVAITDTKGETKEFRLHTLDMPYGKCQGLVDCILGDGTLEINGLEVYYHLEHTPRRHWAFRDQRAGVDSSVISPFSKHSAQVTEYWSFAEEPRERWLEVNESSVACLQPLLARLGFPLARCVDRIGNLMISGAEDDIDCDLTVSQRKALLFSVKGDELLPDTYTATIWANHSDDAVLRQQVAVTQNKIMVDLQSEVDQIGFAVYRNSDGLCVDLMDTYLVMEIHIGMNVETGQTLELRDRRRGTTHRVSPWRSRSTVRVGLDDNDEAPDKEIRRAVLDRKVHQRETDARKEGNWARFGPSQFDEAVEYFLGLLSRHSYSEEPIYLADPYFMARGSTETETKLYLGMFDASVGRPLRILCGHRGSGKPWWSGYPDLLTNHVTVRAFTSRDRPAFHDRYLITPDREIVITNSLNGWSTRGVTFASPPHGLYRVEAESFWSMDVGVPSRGIDVIEVK